MAWLHTWAGLLLGWLLFTIFLAGTASYFREEISRYMRPEQATVPLNQARAADAAQRYLTRHAASANRWFITPPGPRNPGELTVFWRDSERQAHSHQVDVTTGERLSTRDTRGGDFFYRLHFDLHYLSARTARWIVGFAAMMMFVAIISGVITHKRIFKDLFTFRAGKGQRSWLDAHNVLAVMSLPYHLVITYTGLITLMFMYIPWGVSSQYGTDTQPFFDEVFAESPAPEPVGEPAELAALGGLVRQASVHWEGGVAGFITVLNPGDGAARVEMRQDNGLRIAVPTGGVTFDHQGQLLATPHTRGAAARTREVLYGLHLGRFAPPALRAVLFVVGLAGTAMVATGLILWQVKRASAGVGPPVGLRAVGVLNVALVAGLPMAMAGLFWANRLLPLDLAERAAWEIDVFFMVWAGALLLALVRADRRGWRWQLTGAALAFAGVPVLTAITTDRGLPGSLAQGDWAFALFDGAMLVFAALFAVAARLLAERPLAVANATVLARGGGA